MYNRFFLLFAASILLLTNCKSGDEGIEFENYAVEKTVNLSNEEMSPKCAVSINVCSAKETDGNEAAKAINAYLTDRLFNMRDVSMQTAAETFTKKYTTAYRKNMLPLYNYDRKDSTKRVWYEFHYIIKSKAEPASKNTLVYLATIDYYEGGAHGTNQLITFNFDKETGRHLELSDVFAEGYEKPLTDILLKALREKVGAASIAELKEKGYLYNMELFPSENFIINDETITFIYNPYEIAPYEVGTTELTIPYADVAKLLKNSFKY